MILSKNFSTRAAGAFIAAIIFFAGCTAQKEPVSGPASAPFGNGKKVNVAVLPVSNLSGTPAPLQDLRQALTDRLIHQGLNIIDGEVLEKILARHRIRYVGGLNALTARVLGEESGAEFVFITSLELYSDSPPPKIAVTARLVSTGRQPQILWMNSMGLAGDDAPGLLELGLVNDPRILLEMAVQRLTSSMTGFLSGNLKRADRIRPSRKFRPQVSFRSPVLAPDIKYTVAVVPFFNTSERKNAGDIMALHFVRQLGALDNFQVIEPGVVREALLKYRIIMGEGISVGHADILFRKLDADLVLDGKVLEYQDYQGSSGRPKVDFSAQFIERQSREVVWVVKNFGWGDDGVFFFDWGRVNTAHAMASQMVQLAVEDLAE
jgi:TolB-like protein